jgi:hypothetical protein
LAGPANKSMSCSIGVLQPRGYDETDICGYVIIIRQAAGDFQAPKLQGLFSLFEFQSRNNSTIIHLSCSGDLYIYRLESCSRYAMQCQCKCTQPSIPSAPMAILPCATPLSPMPDLCYSVASINPQVRACDVTGCIAAQEGDRTHEILRSSHFTLRDETGPLLRKSWIVVQDFLRSINRQYSNNPRVCTSLTAQSTCTRD